ncbi:MAG: hypothetical protein IJZ34_12620 [Lachnospiraceae bacterium]|nr:hypothetical protein [Lachnospiraceae bacterium]
MVKLRSLITYRLMKGTKLRGLKNPGALVALYPEGKVSVVNKSGISPQVSEKRMKILEEGCF